MAMYAPAPMPYPSLPEIVIIMSEVVAQSFLGFAFAVLLACKLALVQPQSEAATSLFFSMCTIYACLLFYRDRVHAFVRDSIFIAMCASLFLYFTPIACKAPG